MLKNRRALSLEKYSKNWKGCFGNVLYRHVLIYTCMHICNIIIDIKIDILLLFKLQIQIYYCTIQVIKAYLDRPQFNICILLYLAITYEWNYQCYRCMYYRHTNWNEVFHVCYEIQLSGHELLRPWGCARNAIIHGQDYYFFQNIEIKLLLVRLNYIYISTYLQWLIKV